MKGAMISQDTGRPGHRAPYEADVRRECTVIEGGVPFAGVDATSLRCSDIIPKDTVSDRWISRNVNEIATMAIQTATMIVPTARWPFYAG